MTLYCINNICASGLFTERLPPSTIFNSAIVGSAFCVSVSPRVMGPAIVGAPGGVPSLPDFPNPKFPNSGKKSRVHTKPTPVNKGVWCLLPSAGVPPAGCRGY